MSATMLTKAETGYRSAGPADLALGACAIRDVGGQSVLVARGTDGTYQAVSAICSHAQLPLAGGRVRGTAIICPHHGARFCLKTGRALGPPAHEGIAAFPTRERDGEVEIWLI